MIEYILIGMFAFMFVMFVIVLWIFAYLLWDDHLREEGIRLIVSQAQKRYLAPENKKTPYPQFKETPSDGNK